MMIFNKDDKTNFSITMENYFINLKNYSEKKTILKSEYERSVYEKPAETVGFCKYRFKDVKYWDSVRKNEITWNFAKEVEFFHTLYCITDEEIRHAYFDEGKSEKAYPNLSESFKKLPKLPSVHLLMMQALDILALESFLSTIHSSNQLSKVCEEYTKIKELSCQKVDLGMNSTSDPSYYYNDDFFLRLIGKGVYNNIPCKIYEYYSEPSQVEVVNDKLNKTKSSKSLYFGKVFIDEDIGDMVCGEMIENVIPLSGSLSFTQRKILLTRK